MCNKTEFPIYKNYSYTLEDFEYMNRQLVIEAKTDEFLKEKLILHSKKFISFIYSKTKKVYGFTYDDYLQIGYITVCKAISKYKIESKCDFSTFLGKSLTNAFSYKSLLQIQYGTKGVKVNYSDKDYYLKPNCTETIEYKINLIVKSIKKKLKDKLTNKNVVSNSKLRIALAFVDYYIAKDYTLEEIKVKYFPSKSKEYARKKLIKLKSNTDFKSLIIDLLEDEMECKMLNI